MWWCCCVILRIQVSSIETNLSLMWLTGDLCLCKNLANYQSLLVLAHLLWWQAWGQLSMVVSWPGDSSANLLREVIWWQFRSVFSIARRCLQVPQDSKKHLPLVMGCWLSGWIFQVYGVEHQLKFEFSWENWYCYGFMCSGTVSRSMWIPLVYM